MTFLDKMDPKLNYFLRNICYLKEHYKASALSIINLYFPTFSGWAWVFVGLRPDKVYATPHMACGFFTVLKLFASDIV